MDLVARSGGHRRPAWVEAVAGAMGEKSGEPPGQTRGLVKVNNAIIFGESERTWLFKIIKEPRGRCSSPPIGRKSRWLGLASDFLLSPFLKNVEFCRRRATLLVTFLGFLEWRPEIGPGTTIFGNCFDDPPRM
jgi:hypothetical protein